jgi:AhpC/TSA family
LLTSQPRCFLVNMKTKLLVSVLSCIASITVFGGGSSPVGSARPHSDSQYKGPSPPVGSAAPDFVLLDSTGKPHALSQYKGDYVVLEWFNPECPFVKKHYGSRNMQKLQEEFTGKGVVWLTIDSSAPGLEGNLTPEEANQKVAAWQMHSTAPSSRSRRQSWSYLRRQEYTSHIYHQSQR